MLFQGLVHGLNQNVLHALLYKLYATSYGQSHKKAEKDAAAKAIESIMKIDIN